MKFTLVAFVLPALVSAVALESRKVSYDGYKVVRVQTSPKVNKLIADHQLPTWNGRPEDTDFADVVIPPGSDIFKGMKVEVMHDDLGASIAQEMDYQPYVGKYRGGSKPCNGR